MLNVFWWILLLLHVKSTCHILIYIELTLLVKSQPPKFLLPGVSGIIINFKNFLSLNTLKLTEVSLKISGKQLQIVVTLDFNLRSNLLETGSRELEVNRYIVLLS